MSAVVGHRAQLGAAMPGVRANSGGPASRRRTERVVASVLRDYDRIFHLQRVIRVGLHFGGHDPLQAVLE